VFVRPLFPHKKAGGKELSLKQGENNEERKQRRKDGWNKKARKEGRRETRVKESVEARNNGWTEEGWERKRNERKE